MKCKYTFNIYFLVYQRQYLKKILTFKDDTLYTPHENYELFSGKFGVSSINMLKRNFHYSFLRYMLCMSPIKSSDPSDD